jgi:hypothetical protein
MYEISNIYETQLCMNFQIFMNAIMYEFSNIYEHHYV